MNEVEIISEDIPGWQVSNVGSLTVALDVTITPSLWEEGMAREIINRIQNLRKESGFDVSDRIELAYSGVPEVIASVKNFSEYILNETLSVKLEASSLGENGILSDINGLECKILIRKI